MKIKIYFFTVLVMLTEASASIVHMTSDTSNWKLENYSPGGTVVVWYTDSSCTNGKIQFQSSVTSEEKNRFWSVVLTSKASSKKMFVRYDTNGCYIKSFGMN